MNRYDLYTTVHKGLRKGLFEAAALVARTDFGRDREVARAVAEVRRMLDFLHDHAEHEEAAAMPELGLLAPELRADLHGDHTRLSGLELELRGLLERVQEARGCERESLGRKLTERLTALVAEHLRHMGVEEARANRVLWAHRSDDDLRGIEGRILASISPWRLTEWLVLMLPAMNATERRAMLADMAEHMPTVEFEVLTGPARAALGENAWQDAAPALVR